MTCTARSVTRTRSICRPAAKLTMKATAIARTSAPRKIGIRVAPTDRNTAAEQQFRTVMMQIRMMNPRSERERLGRISASMNTRSSMSVP